MEFKKEDIEAMIQSAVEKAMCGGRCRFGGCHATVTNNAKGMCQEDWLPPYPDFAALGCLYARLK